MWTCVSPRWFLGQMVSNEWGYFLAVFMISFSQWQKIFSLFDSICVIFIFQFFLVIVYNLALFFQTSQPKVTRPLATLGWRPKECTFSLVSDCLSALRRHLVASLLRYWLDLELEVYQILGGPLGRLSKANTRPPLLCSPDLLPEQSSLRACPTTLGNLSAQDTSIFVFWVFFVCLFSFQIVGEGD